MVYLVGAWGMCKSSLSVQACILPKSIIKLTTPTSSLNTCLHSGLLQKPQAPMFYLV